MQAIQSSSQLFGASRQPRKNASAELRSLTCSTNCSTSSYRSSKATTMLRGAGVVASLLLLLLARSAVPRLALSSIHATLLTVLLLLLILLLLLTLRLVLHSTEQLLRIQHSPGLDLSDLGSASSWEAAAS